MFSPLVELIIAITICVEVVSEYLINFRSNDFIEDIVNLQEIINYIAVEGFEVEQVDLDCKDFEIIDERILLY